MSTVRVETAFKPSLYGFHFKNRFDFELGDVGWGSRRCVENVVTGGLSQAVYYGRVHHLCGGMCWAALDRYFRNTPGPIPPDRDPPAVGSPLLQELFDRQVDTLANGALVAKCWDWMNRPNEGHWYDGSASIGHLVQSEEWPHTKDWLDRGFPVSLCLIRVRGIWEGGGASVWDNHQVLAWGYRFDDSSNRVELLLYDPNYPDANDVVIAFTLGRPHSKLSMSHSRGDSVRGFFEWRYDRTMIYVPKAVPRRRRDVRTALAWLLLDGTSFT